MRPGDQAVTRGQDHQQILADGCDVVLAGHDEHATGGIGYGINPGLDGETVGRVHRGRVGCLDILIGAIEGEGLAGLARTKSNSIDQISVIGPSRVAGIPLPTPPTDEARGRWGATYLSVSAEWDIRDRQAHTENDDRKKRAKPRCYGGFHFVGYSY